MKRITKISPRIGDENLYYGVEPSSKGVKIDSSSTGDVLALSDNGWTSRDLSKTGVSTIRLLDPNYYETDTWMSAPVVEFNNDTTLKLGEELICTVVNISSHLSVANPSNDMVYTWVPDGDQSRAITGGQIRITPTEDETWEVKGISPTLGSTLPYVFNLYVDDAENPIPLIQTITGGINNTLVFRILNHEMFVGTVIEYQIYDTDPSSPEATSTSETINFTLGTELGIRYLNIRALIDGTPTESRKIPIITNNNSESVVNHQAYFEPVSGNTRTVLTDFTGFGTYGNTGAFQVNLFTEEREIELINVVGAKLIKSGVFFDKGIVEIEFNESSTNYDITFQYLIRKKGTVGGLRYNFVYTGITSANQPPYDFRLEVAERMAQTTNGTLSVKDQYVHEVGYYQYSLNAEAISILGLAATPSTRFEMNDSIEYNLSSGVGTYTITATVYDLLDQVVKVISQPFETFTGSHTSYTVDPLNDYYHGTLFTGVNSTDSAHLFWEIPLKLPLVGDSLDLDNMKVFDIFDINYPTLLTNRLGNYGFLGSSDYPYEFYRDSDVTNYLTNENPTDSMLEAYRKVNLALDTSGDKLTSCNTRIVSSGSISFIDHQCVRHNALNTASVDGIHIAEIMYDGLSLTLDQKWASTYSSLVPTMTAVANANPNTQYQVYLVGPNRVIMVMIPVLTNSVIPDAGTTIVEWTDEDHPTSQYLILDPDVEVGIQDTSGIITFTGAFTFRTIALGTGATVQIIADTGLGGF